MENEVISKSFGLRENDMKSDEKVIRKKMKDIEDY